MDGSGPIVVVMPIMILLALFTTIAPPFIAGRRSGRSQVGAPTSAAGRKARPPKPGASGAATVEYLYVPCVRIHYNGYVAETRRWVQEVLIVRKTAKWIYYASDSWDRGEAVVSPGCISREDFEADTRCHDECPRDIAAGLSYTWDHCPHGESTCRHGYPAGVIPIPGDHHRPGPAGRQFFATREAAKADLDRRECKRAEQAARQAPPIVKLRHAMADAHPDRGGTAEQFIEARRRYETALRSRTLVPRA
jgi:hypothetical protein